MIRTLEVYETADGRRFDCEAKAREHVADSVRAMIDSRLAALVQGGRLSASDSYRVTMAIVPDAESLAKLSAAIAALVDYD